MAKTTAETINRQNKITLLNLIRQMGPVSRAELAKVSGMSAPTVTRIVDSLINREKLVHDAGEGNSSGGRRPSLVAFSGDRYYVIGIDLSPRYISAVLTDLNSRVIGAERIPSLREEGYSRVMEQAGGIIEKLKADSGLPDGKIIGVGLGVAGFIDVHRGAVITSPNFGWQDVRPDEELSRYTSLPVVFDNLTRVMALGELHYGAGDRFDNFICLKLGMGLGAGMILDRRPYFGAHGFGSEAGHMIIDPESSRRCSCGNRGCFEALVAGHYILDAVEEVLDGEEYASLMGQVDPLEGAIGLINGDPERFASLREHLVIYLAQGLINLIHAYDPQAIVLGGVISELGPLLLEPVRERVQKLSVLPFRSECEILCTVSGEKAVAMGAVALVLERVLNLSL